MDDNLARKSSQSGSEIWYHEAGLVPLSKRLTLRLSDNLISLGICRQGRQEQTMLGCVGTWEFEIFQRRVWNVARVSQLQVKVDGQKVRLLRPWDANSVAGHSPLEGLNEPAREAFRLESGFLDGWRFKLITAALAELSRGKIFSLFTSRASSGNLSLRSEIVSMNYDFLFDGRREAVMLWHNRQKTRQQQWL